MTRRLISRPDSDVSREAICVCDGGHNIVRLAQWVQHQIDGWRQTARIYDVLTHPEKYVRELDDLEARYKVLAEEYSEYAEKGCDRRQGSQVRN
jgi:uncharacterized protein (DUF934 family)